MGAPRVLLTSLLGWLLVGVAACGDNAGSEPVKITLDPASPQLAAGEMLDVTAQFVRADQSSAAAGDATWTVGDAAIATVTPGQDGHATIRGIATGTTTLTVAGQGASSAFSVTVSPAVLVSIAITPPVPSFAAGTAVQLTATGVYSDATTRNLAAIADWSSSAIATATVDATGLVHGIAAGEATITAALGTIRGTVGATVTSATLTSIEVTPFDPRLALGIHQQFTATGVFSDHTTQDLTGQATWTSDADAHASVVPTTGLVTAVALGTATIKAAMGSVSGTSRVTVTPAVLASIEIDPAAPSVARGRTLQLTAAGIFTDGSVLDLTAQAAWASETPDTATISNAAGSKGLATAVQVGSTKITAALNGLVGTTTLEVTPAVVVSIQVTPVNPTISAGTRRSFVATGTFSDTTTQDLTTQVTWDSSAPAIATISNADPTRGEATSVAPGTTTITAQLGSVLGSTTLTVNDATLVTIQLMPLAPALATGLTLGFVATGVFTDGNMQDLTEQVMWSSSNPAIAEISNAATSRGQAKALAEGATTITATLGSVVAATTLTVTPAVVVGIDVVPADPSLPIGHRLGFVATGRFSDGSTGDLTSQVAWTSSIEAVAPISNAAGDAGVATGVSLGTTTITAVFPAASGPVSGTTTLTVSPAVLDAIEVTPGDGSLAKGRHLQFAALGRISDGTTEDLTTQVTWSSTVETVAQISSAADSPGLATAVAPGITVITAMLDGVAGTTGLTVTPPVVDSILVTPQIGVTGPGLTRQFTATGTLSDGTKQDVTTQVTWTSFDPGIATVSSVGPTSGLATGVTVGKTSITATLADLISSATITVVLPNVAATLPRDATTGIRVSTPIVITFDQMIDPATLITQTVAGPCGGTLQVSADDFATCVGFSAAAPALATGADGGTIATAMPAAALQPATYKIRVLDTVTNAGGARLSVTFTLATGFTTATAGSCASSLVISQVYGGGGNTNAPLRNDFIELHNRGAQPVDLTGYAVQFASASGTTWQVQALPSMIVPAGGYFLIQEAAGANTGLPFPVADFVPTNAFMMGATSGKVALTPSPTPLSGACPIIVGLSNDLVGYGANLTCFEGGAGVPAPSNTTAALRNNAGCTDSDDNKADFAVATPAPRNAATVLNVCACSN